MHRSKVGLFFSISLLLAFLSGCQSTVENTIVEQPEFIPPSPLELATLPNTDEILSKYQIPTPLELITLTEEQQQEFLSFYNHPDNAETRPHKRVFEYINRLYFQFDYLGGTFDAKTTLSQHGGNCMSLALLTGAFANLANLDVRYQRVSSVPIYRRYENVMTLSSHVRTHLYAPVRKAKNRAVFLPARVVIDYYRQRGDIRGDMIENSQFYSMYYRNLAADAVVRGEHEYAYALIHKALTISPTDQENINTMAVILTEMQQTDMAFSLYESVTHGQVNSLSLLSNYVNLLGYHGFDEKAQQYKVLLVNVEDDNPYEWLDLAEERIEDGNPQRARYFLEKALDYAPYMHEAYFSLAKTFYMEERVKEADRALTRATELANLPETRRLYNAKRMILTNEQR